MARIVVVEDETELAAAIAARLRSDGHSVTWRRTARARSSWSARPGRTR